MCMERLVASVALGVFLGLASLPVWAANAAPPQGQAGGTPLQQQLDSIRHIAQANNLVLEHLKVVKLVGGNARATGNCRVAAEIRTRGSAGVTFSATSAKCADAAKIVAGSVKQAAAAVAPE